MPLNTTLDDERIATLTRERDEARATALKYQALHVTTETKLLEARAGEARAKEVLDWLAEQLAEARDAALEEAAMVIEQPGPCTGARFWLGRIRALKRGGK
jgi:hypothetical protein